MDNLMGSPNTNSAGFRSEFCLSALSDIYFPVCWQFLSLPKSHTCFYPSFIASIVKFPGAAWLRLISPCLYRESVFSTASFSVHSIHTEYKHNPSLIFGYILHPHSQRRFSEKLHAPGTFRIFLAAVHQFHKTVSPPVPFLIQSRHQALWR